MRCPTLRALILAEVIVYAGLTPADGTSVFFWLIKFYTSLFYVYTIINIYFLARFHREIFDSLFVAVSVSVR